MHEPGPRVSGWWAQRRRRQALTLALALYAVVFVLRFTVGDATDAISMFYVLPVALVASAYGWRGGLLAAIAGMALFATWDLTTSAEIGVLGWVVRAMVMTVLGVLVGMASDAMLTSAWEAQVEYERRLKVEASRQRELEALEFNDLVVQAMVAAKWMVERGQQDDAVDALCSAIGAGQQLVAGLLPPSVTSGLPTKPMTLYDTSVMPPSTTRIEPVT